MGKIVENATEKRRFWLSGIKLTFGKKV